MGATRGAHTRSTYCECIFTDGTLVRALTVVRPQVANQTRLVQTRVFTVVASVQLSARIMQSLVTAQRVHASYFELANLAQILLILQLALQQLHIIFDHWIDENAIVQIRRVTVVIVDVFVVIFVTFDEQIGQILGARSFRQDQRRQTVLKQQIIRQAVFQFIPVHLVVVSFILFVQLVSFALDLLVGLSQ